MASPSGGRLTQRRNTQGIKRSQLVARPAINNSTTDQLTILLPKRLFIFPEDSYQQQQDEQR
jgi:hypothetical protein